MEGGLLAGFGELATVLTGQPPAPFSCTGRFLFRQYPVIHSILAPLQPLITLYFGFPLARCGTDFEGFHGAEAALPRTGLHAHGTGRPSKQAAANEHGVRSASLRASAHTTSPPPRAALACSLIIFFALYSGVVNNMSVRRVGLGLTGLWLMHDGTPAPTWNCRERVNPPPFLQPIHPSEHAPSRPAVRHVGVSCGEAGRDKMGLQLSISPLSSAGRQP